MKQPQIEEGTTAAARPTSAAAVNSHRRKTGQASQSVRRKTALGQIAEEKSSRFPDLLEQQQQQPDFEFPTRNNNNDNDMDASHMTNNADQDLELLDRVHSEALLFPEEGYQDEECPTATGPQKRVSRRSRKTRDIAEEEEELHSTMMRQNRRNRGSAVMRTLGRQSQLQPPPPLMEIPGSGTQKDVDVEKNPFCSQGLDDDDDDVDSQQMETALTEDTCSLMCTAPLNRPAFSFACFTFLAQFSILTLILVDLIDMSDDPPTTGNGVRNRLKIPVGVSPFVTVAHVQFFSVFLVVSFSAFQGDTLVGIEHLMNGFNRDVLKDNPHATLGKWATAGILQILVGVMMTLNSFVLLLQSRSVLELCLNFAALHFVSDVDEVLFRIASMGLFSKPIQRECLAVGQIMIPSKRRQATAKMRKVFTGSLFIVLYGCFFGVMRKQWAGLYICESVFVKFGDTYGTDLSYYSGRFVSQGFWVWEREDGREFYLHESGHVKLAYSTKEGAWLFKWNEPVDDEHSYLIKSSDTETYDVTSVSDNIWFANVDDDAKPMDWLSVSCNDCIESRCNPDYGTCQNNQCVCNDGRLGANCESESPQCSYYALDLRTKGSLSNYGGRSFFTNGQFEVLRDDNTTDFGRNLTIHYRNVYAHSQMHALIAFSGRRWIIFGSPLGDARDTSLHTLKRYFDEIFIYDMNSLDALKTLANFSDFQPLFYSTPVDLSAGAPSNGGDFVGLSWQRAEREEDKKIDGHTIFGYKPSDRYTSNAKFLCAECQADSDCQNEGLCDIEQRVCQCQMFYEGLTCENVKSCQKTGCFNEGTCNQVTGVCQDCFRGASGNLCQYPLPSDIEDPYFCHKPRKEWTDVYGMSWPKRGECAHKQTCDAMKKGCLCEPPFYGDACMNSTQVDCFAIMKNTNFIDPCMNGGYCDLDLFPTAICRCRSAYTGDLCEIPTDGRPTQNSSSYPNLVTFVIIPDD